MSKLSRRSFIETTALGAGGALVLARLAACQRGGGTDGSITPVNGQATLSFAQYPALMTAGDGVVVDAPNGPLAVIRTGATTATALSAVCTHSGCTVEVQSGSGTTLFCPCHGSEFDVNGRVLAGPARTPLKVYTAALDMTGVTVTLA